MVQNIFSISSTFSSITVTWDELSCVERNGVITGYRIEYGNTTFHRTNLVVGESNTTLTVTGLHPLSTYMLRVAAFNGIDIGPHSSYQYYQTKAVPIVNITVTRNSITPTEDREYVLNCNVSVPQSLMVNSITYKWLKNFTTLPDHSSNRLIFSPLDRQDHGRYSCRVIIISPLLSSEIVAQDSIILQVTGILY